MAVVHGIFDFFFALAIIFNPGADTEKMNIGSPSKVMATFTLNADGWWVGSSTQKKIDITIKVAGDELTIVEDGKNPRKASLAKIIPRPKGFDPKTATELTLKGAKLAIKRGLDGRITLEPKERKQGGPLSLTYVKKRPAPKKK